MSKPRQRPATPRSYSETPESLIVSTKNLWEPLEGFPGYVATADGRLAREIKVRTNKNGTRFARVMRRGKQTVIRL